VTEFIHEPVLLEEALSALQPAAGRLYVDGTVGGGGHAEAILEASGPDGRLVGFDRDDWALAAAARRLKRFGDRLELHREPFAGLAKCLAKASCDGVLLDLGVSSPQLDEAERGFSFQVEGPLDMRMDRRQPVSAAQLVNELEAGELATIFWELGGERRSRRIARAIVEQRDMQRIETTLQLADTVERACPRRGARTHPATGVFQALRMAVNDELGQVQAGLDAAWSVLKPGGRLLVHDFMVNDSLDGPRLGALWALQHVAVNAGGLGLPPSGVISRMGAGGFDTAKCEATELIKGMTKLVVARKDACLPGAAVRQGHEFVGI
jgi:16S rRNA (cytosine1402-N4)-methyltransferase